MSSPEEVLGCATTEPLKDNEGGDPCQPATRSTNTPILDIRLACFLFVDCSGVKYTRTRPFEDSKLKDGRIVCEPLGRCSGARCRGDPGLKWGLGGSACELTTPPRQRQAEVSIGGQVGAAPKP
jgi:hypothetical protein